MNNEAEINQLQDAINNMVKEYCKLFSETEEYRVWDFIDFAEKCKNAMNALEEMLNKS